MIDKPWHQNSGNDLLLHLHVQPGAKKSEIAGRHGDALKIRIAAPPREGEANAALIRFVAELFSVPHRRIALESGAGSRQKTIRVRSVALLPEALAKFDGDV